MGESHVGLVGAFGQLGEEIASPDRTPFGDDCIEGVEPLLGFDGVDVMQLVYEGVAEAQVTGGHDERETTRGRGLEERKT